MKYAVLKQVNGSFLVASEWGTNLNGAINGWHTECINLRNASEAVDAVVKVVDSNLDTVDGYIEFISHEKG